MLAPTIRRMTRRTFSSVDDEALFLILFPAVEGYAVTMLVEAHERKRKSASRA